MEDYKIGSNIQKRRKLIKKTQDEIAEKVGVSKGQISKWENAKSSPSIANFVKISDALNIHPEMLIAGEIEEDFIENREKKEHKEKVIKLFLCMFVIFLFLRFVIRIYQQFIPNCEEQQYKVEIIYQKPLENGMWEVRQLVKRYDDVIWADTVIYQKDGMILDAKVLEVTDIYGNNNIEYEAILKEDINKFIILVHYEIDEVKTITFEVECVSTN